MAIRGPKSKPAYLKVVTGNPGRRPIKEDPADAVEPGFDNGLEPPKKLKKRQQELWNAYIRKAAWLTSFDVPRSFMWVELQVQFESDPANISSTRIAQLRALGSELGLDPASRTRLGGNNDDGKKDRSDAYFK